MPRTMPFGASGIKCRSSRMSGPRYQLRRRWVCAKELDPPYGAESRILTPDSFSLPQAVDERRHVARKGHHELHMFAGDGVLESQLGRVQGQARGAALVEDRFAGERPPVTFIADSRRSAFRQQATQPVG